MSFGDQTFHSSIALYTYYPLSYIHPVFFSITGIFPEGVVNTELTQMHCAHKSQPGKYKGLQTFTVVLLAIWPFAIQIYLCIRTFSIQVYKYKKQRKPKIKILTPPATEPAANVNVKLGVCWLYLCFKFS